jgi:hypothetical protein
MVGWQYKNLEKEHLMTKEWVPAFAVLFIILFFVTLIVVFTQPSVPAKPSTSDIMTCEIDKAGGFHSDPCPTN